MRVDGHDTPMYASRPTAPPSNIRPHHQLVTGRSATGCSAAASAAARWDFNQRPTVEGCTPSRAAISRFVIDVCARSRSASPTDPP